MIGQYSEYKPSPVTQELLDAAYGHVQSVPYTVTARWVFYRLLQDGLLAEKADYKRLLGYLSRARKAFYKQWRPNTLADDTRAANVRGIGFSDGKQWLEAVAEQERCNLDRWEGQPNYLEVWFEAAAMEAQFEFYTNENIPLLAFHGDVSIPEKWKAAVRLSRRWTELDKPIVILYYGDLDPKGLQIPESAWEDIQWFLIKLQCPLKPFEFIRVGLNNEHPEKYEIPENPERPGTYQWEGLSDEGAAELIAYAEDYIDLDAFDRVKDREEIITQKFHEHLMGLEL